MQETEGKQVVERFLEQGILEQSEELLTEDTLQMLRRREYPTSW